MFRKGAIGLGDRVSSTPQRVGLLGPSPLDIHRHRRPPTASTPPPSPSPPHRSHPRVHPVQSIITIASTLHTHCASTWCQDRITYNHQSLILIFAVHIAHFKAALITATVQATTSTSQTRHSQHHSFVPHSPYVAPLSPSAHIKGSSPRLCSTRRDYSSSPYALDSLNGSVNHNDLSELDSSNHYLFDHGFSPLRPGHVGFLARHALVAGPDSASSPRLQRR